MNRQVEESCGEQTITQPFYRGSLEILVNNDGVCGCKYDPEGHDTAKPSKRPRPTGMAKRVLTEMNEYLCGRGKRFTVPILLQGTDFQKNVWRALMEIPYGKTASYGEIADALNAPRASRAVGNAVGANPYLLFVPCHRVIRSNGELGGFGCGIDVKKYILKAEGIVWE